MRQGNVLQVRYINFLWIPALPFGTRADRENVGPEVNDSGLGGPTLARWAAVSASRFGWLVRQQA